MKLKTLGKTGSKFTGLETFPTPPGVTVVTCRSDEVSAMCPVTGQPDWYVVEIVYAPRAVCVESKTLKLYLQSFRNDGHFCEKFASIICERIKKDLNPASVTVTITQKPRGGIAIIAHATLPRPD